ncbi:hypothetical protein HYV57_03445 [Candidatus Peregrinibacteria bacterium]|nr:hypothetical protein [Candidatus Peregrinibacteria bacterium]
MSVASKLAILRELLESAESNIRSAKQIMNDLVKGTGPEEQYTKMASTLSAHVTTDEGQIVEGVFDGQNMIDSDKKSYPVPANYASKSKLIPGDVLKLTITQEGSFKYKQIGPAERKRVTGPLTYEDGQYRVIANSKAYKVLLASVTYFRAETGDQIVLIVPEFEESEWGAIENVLPKNEMEGIENMEIDEEEKKIEKKKTKISSKKK